METASDHLGAGAEGDDDDRELTTLPLLRLIADDDVDIPAASLAGAAPAVDDEPAATSATRDAQGVEASPPLFAFDETSALLLDLDLDLDVGLDLSTDDLDFCVASIEGERPVSGDPANTDGEPGIVVESGLSSQVRAHREALDPQLQCTATSRIRSVITRAPWEAFMHKGRKNAKMELEYLREQVQALEQQLGDLQNATAPPDDNTAKVTTSSSSTSSPLDPLWEQIAQRQKDEKQKAEVENAKLREMLEGQLKVASSLEKILRKRPNASWLETFELDPDSKRLRREDESEADAFAILSEEIAGLYAQLDSVLMETGLANKTHEVRDVQVKSDANDHMFMELLDSKILPFDLSISSAAVWKVAGISRTKLKNGHYGAIDSTDDTVRSQFSVTLHLRRAQVLIRINMAVRKIVEANRVVMLWSSVGTSEGSLLGSHQIKIRERGWAVVKPVSKDSSLLQIVVRVAPELCHFVSAKDHQQAGVLTDLIMGSYHQNMDAIHQLIENSLLAEAASDPEMLVDVDVTATPATRRDSRGTTSTACAVSKLGDLAAMGSEELQRDEDELGLDMRHLLGTSSLSSASSLSRDGVCGGRVDLSTGAGGMGALSGPFAQSAIDGGDDDDLLADALLFTLEEEEELLLLDGVDDNAIDLSGLDFSEFGVSISEDTQLMDQGTPSPGVDTSTPAVSSMDESMSPTSADEKPHQPPIKKTESQPPRVPKLRAIKPTDPIIAPITGVAAAATASTTLKTGKKPNASRKRVKDELEYLRQHVGDLEEQLQQLKSNHSGRNDARLQLARNGEFSDTQDALALRGASPVSSSSSSTLWKRVASHQMDERRKAETENTRLRDLLEAQLRLTRSLARSLRKRANLTDLDTNRPDSEVKWLRFNPHGVNTRSIYDHLEETLGPLYARVDTVLAETGFATAKKEVREGQMKTDAAGRLFLQVVDSNIVPFGHKVTSTGIWKLFSRAASMNLNGGVYQALDATSDTIRAQFAVSLKLRGADALLNAHLIGRQTIEENRVVMVWSTFGESQGDLFGSERVVFHETGWTVIEELPATEETPSTIIQTVVRMSPQVAEGTSDCSDSADREGSAGPTKLKANHVGVLTDLVLSSFNQNLEAMHQLIENIIMTEVAQA